MILKWGDSLYHFETITPPSYVRHVRTRAVLESQTHWWCSTHTQADGLKPMLQINYIQFGQNPELVGQPDAVCCHCMISCKTLKKALLVWQDAKTSDCRGEWASKSTLPDARLIDWLKWPPDCWRSIGSTYYWVACKTLPESTCSHQGDLCLRCSFPQRPGGCNSKRH